MTSAAKRALNGKKRATIVNLDKLNNDGNDDNSSFVKSEEVVVPKNPTVQRPPVTISNGSGKKRSRIAKIGDKFYDMGTSNRSFLKVAEELRTLGINNCYFMLEIKDYSLVNIDPFSVDAEGNPNLTKDQISRICIEVARNPWYFLREIVRIPDPGGSVVPYKANRGNIAQAWCIQNGIDSWLCLPRQQGKTMSALAFQVWMYLFGTKNSAFIFVNKDGQNAKENLRRMIKIINSLPVYLQAKSVIIDDKRVKAKENATEIVHPFNGNSVKIRSKATSYDMALSLARGLTAPVLHFDEPEFTNHIGTIVSNSVSTFETAAERAAANNAMYGRIFTCTPGDLDTAAGMEAQVILDNTAKWTERMYEWTKEEIEEYIDSFGMECNRILYIEYSYKQIGKTEAWLHKVAAKIGNALTVRREILLQRLHGSSLSPYPQEDIDYIVQCERKPIGEFWLLEYFKFTLYEVLNKTIPYLVGVDCSTGTNGDNNAITIINPYTLEPVAEFESSYIGETKFEKLLIALVRDYIPRCCMVIERNSVGDSIIDHLLVSPIAGRLYYDRSLDLVKDKMSHNETIESMLKKNASRKSYYGVYTGVKSREDMFAILGRHVAEFKEKFVSHNVIRDLSRLVRTASGKIEAAKGVDENGNSFHDDSIMSYLIALYVYYHGNNLAVFGIDKYDPDKAVHAEKREKRAAEINPQYVDPALINAVKEQELKERKTKLNSWEYLQKQAIMKAQAEDYKRYEKGLVDNSIYADSDTSGYELDDLNSGKISMNFFKEINGITGGGPGQFSPFDSAYYDNNPYPFYY